MVFTDTTRPPPTHARLVQSMSVRAPDHPSRAFSIRAFILHTLRAQLRFSLVYFIWLRLLDLSVSTGTFFCGVTRCLFVVAPDIARLPSLRTPVLHRFVRHCVAQSRAQTHLAQSEYNLQSKESSEFHAGSSYRRTERAECIQTHMMINLNGESGSTRGPPDDPLPASRCRLPVAQKV